MITAVPSNHKFLEDPVSNHASESAEEGSSAGLKAWSIGKFILIFCILITSG